MLNLLKSNRGITLVELLASITITAIVIVLISNVLITSFRHQDQSQSHLNLRQEANLIVTELRNVHSGDNQFELCNINNRILLNDRQLSRESVLIEELLINERPLASNSKSECLMVDPKVPLPVHFTLNDKNNNPFKLETVLHRLESNNQISVTIPDGDDEEAGEDPENTDIDFYEDKSEFGNIDRIDYSDYQSVAFTQQMFCAYDSNAISEQTTFDFSNGTSCLTSQVKAGSIYIQKYHQPFRDSCQK